MEISASIRSRAIGLLNSFREESPHGNDSILAATSNPSDNGKSSGNGHLRQPNSTFGVADRTIDPVPNSGEYAQLSSDDVRRLIAWLNAKVTKDSLSETTAKCYRRWLASYFESVNDPCANVIRNWIPPGSHEAALLIDEVDARLLTGPKLDMSPAPSIAEANGNSRYYDYLEKSTLGLLLEVLVSPHKDGLRYVLGPAAALMFTSTLMTGLRPMEWFSARYRESFYDPEHKITLGPVLDVLTLKQHGRREDNPHRERRYMVLDGWPQEQIDTLKSFLAMIEEHAGEPEAFYNRIRITIRRAWLRTRKLQGEGGSDKALHDDDDHDDVEAEARLPQHMMDSGLSVGLYTARHIFAEESRRSRELTRFELAALLGHSMLTNQVYYGPRHANDPRGYAFVLPRPWPGDADDIMRWDATVNPRRNQFRQGDLFAGPQPTKADLEESLWLEAEHTPRGILPL